MTATLLSTLISARGPTGPAGSAGSAGANGPTGPTGPGGTFTTFTAFLASLTDIEGSPTAGNVLVWEGSGNTSPGKWIYAGNL